MHSHKLSSRPTCNLIFAMIAVLATASSHVMATIYYVDIDAPGGDGLSWPNASNDLQDVLLNDATFGDTVFVAQGTYKPTTGTNRSISFIPANGVILRGSYIGYDDADPDQRNVFEFDTILSGDIGTPDDNSDNSYHVIRGSLTGTEFTEFNGFIIRDGRANGSPPNDNKGAGVWARTPMRFINSTFDSNTTPESGGAIWTKDSAHVTVRNCIFRSNSAGGFGGGAIFADGQFTALTVHVANSLFIYNHASNRGGAVLVHNDTTMVLANCTFSGNTTVGSGSAVWSQCILPVTYIRNCIIWGNLILPGGGSNSQVSGQSCGGGQPPADIRISYSDIESSIEPEWDFGNNISSDPFFSDPGADNYRLLAISPAIDAGNQALTPVDTFDVDDDTNTTERTPDLDWRDRVIDGNDDMTDEVDMGPYESVPCPADLDGDCVVGVKDLVILLGDWGSCEGCPADFDFDDAVGVKDLLFLLGAWGPCPCDPTAVVMSLREKLADVCMSEANWDKYEDKMTDPEASQEDKDRYDCWMRHYLFECTCMACQSHSCPAPDPFSP